MTAQPGNLRVHTETYRVPFGDTDGAGVVFYPNYYRWFDRMTHELFRRLGRPLLDYGLESQGPVLAEAHCTFLSPTRYDDVVDLKATVARVTNRSIRIEHEVSRDRAVVARGYEVRVWVSLIAGQAHAIPLPQEIAAALSNDPPLT